MGSVIMISKLPGRIQKIGSD